ncbi:MAG: hypothetical protein LHV69_09325 [Elusimicrobia bacterium]|nr:hypothetical protein [Candidatus Obscuribacterium magneticum]
MDENQEIPSASSGKKKLSNDELLAGKSSAGEQAPGNHDPRFKSPDELLLQLIKLKGTPQISPVLPEPAESAKKSSPLPNSFDQDLPRIQSVKSIFEKSPIPPRTDIKRPASKAGPEEPLPWDIDEKPAAQEAAASEKAPPPMRVIKPASDVIGQLANDIENDKSLIDLAREMRKETHEPAPAEEDSEKAPKGALDEIIAKSPSQKRADLEQRLEEWQDKYERDISRWLEYEQSVCHWKDRVLEIVQQLKKEVAETNALRVELRVLREEIKRREEEIEELRESIKKRRQNGG